MAFPASPTVGDRWTEYGRVWQFDGVGWGPVVGPDPLYHSVPAYLADGTPSPIRLNSDGTLSAYLANGTYSPIPTQA